MGRAHLQIFVEVLISQECGKISPSFIKIWSCDIVVIRWGQCERRVENILHADVVTKHQ